MKVAIIEDDMAIGFSLRMALEDRGHDVTVYEDPTAVPYGTLDAEVILLDFYMPKMNGEQVLERLREQGSNAKVILMSASPHMNKVAEQLRVHHLPKPFDLNILYQYVEAP